MKTIKECFNVILKGNKKDSCLAARQVRKLLHNSSDGRMDKYDMIKKILGKANDNYNKISEGWRQENFVVAVSAIYFLHDKNDYLDFLFPWFFKLLEHPKGAVRYAAVRMFTDEIDPLTVHIRHPGFKSGYFNSLPPDKADKILFSLFVTLKEQLDNLWQPKFRKYKYVRSLPPSPFKSVQMVMARLAESCGEKYMRFLTYKYKIEEPLI